MAALAVLALLLLAACGGQRAAGQKRKEVRGGGEPLRGAPEGLRAHLGLI